MVTPIFFSIFSLIMIIWINTGSLTAVKLILLYHIESKLEKMTLFWPETANSRRCGGKISMVTPTFFLFYDT